MSVGYCRFASDPQRSKSPQISESRLRRWDSGADCLTFDVAVQFVRGISLSLNIAVLAISAGAQPVRVQIRFPAQ
jgi:hypothetical protein